MLKCVEAKRDGECSNVSKTPKDAQRRVMICEYQRENPMTYGIMHSATDIINGRAYIDQVFGVHRTEYRVTGNRSIHFKATRQAEDICRTSSNIDWIVA